MDGVSPPSLNSVSLLILAKGSLGLGSLGVPSTRAHFPIVLSHPTMLFSTQQCTCNEAPCKMMDSLTRTPAPIHTPFPMDTLGPMGSMRAVGWMNTFPGHRKTQL
uniref:Uncharacterized protein n=1 Tax=Denticeps clupeoides TaxID=299321 RepID=A0AAY4AUG4_9TELE